MTSPTPAAAIADPALLGHYFSGSSWGRWRAILKAAYAEPLSPEELALFQEVAERDPPAQPVRELWIIAGRRSGKDSIASAIATVAAIGDYRERLRPGEMATVMCLAVDRDQARIVHRYIGGYFDRIPALAGLVQRETADGLELANNVDVIVGTNSFRAVRGRAFACAIFDECAFWREESSATPDFATYEAVIPGFATIPGALLVGISSPYRRSGLLFDRWRRYYAQNDPEILVVKGASRLFNPTLPPAIVERALERDPEAASAEWLAEWRSDLADFVSRAAVDAAIEPGCIERPAVAGIQYLGFCDPSGGSADSMTLAIAHAAEDGRAILDAVREARPPFSPENVVAEFAALLKSYRVTTVRGDRYAGEWPRERFSVHGINYKPADKTTSELYGELLPLLNGKRVDLLDHPRLVAQLCSLERRATRGGRDSISHPVGGHDDGRTPRPARSSKRLPVVASRPSSNTRASW